MCKYLLDYDQCILSGKTKKDPRYIKFYYPLQNDYSPIGKRVFADEMKRRAEKLGIKGKIGDWTKKEHERIKSTKGCTKYLYFFVTKKYPLKLKDFKITKKYLIIKNYPNKDKIMRIKLEDIKDMSNIELDKKYFNFKK